MHTRAILTSGVLALTLLLSACSSGGTKPSQNTIDLVVGTYNFGSLLDETLTAMSFYFDVATDDLPAEDLTVSVTGPAGWNDGDTFELTLSSEEVASGWAWRFAPTAIASGEYRLEAQIGGETYNSSASLNATDLLPVPPYVTVTTFDETVVTGSWMAPAGARSYRPTLYRAPVSLDAELLASEVTTATSITLDELALTPGRYFLGVLAFNIDRTLDGQPEKPEQFNVSVAVSEPFAVSGAQRCTDPEQAVTIPDDALEQAIRDTLAKAAGDLTCADLESLNELEANDRSIVNLEGLQHAVNLKDLQLSDNEVGDLSPLSNLGELEWLNLNLNRVSDLAPLQNLTGLRGLNLCCDSNSYTDISPLANLTDLLVLDIGGHGLADISVLEGFGGLKFAWVWSNELDDADMSVFEGKDLELLNFSGNSVTDLAFLSDFPNLKHLVVSYNPIGDLSPVFTLTGLEWLELNGLGIGNLDFLASFTKLINLSLRDNNIADISVLVANSGIGEGDTVDISDNLLDLEDPSVQADIQALLDRGVSLTYEPQNP